MATPFAAPDNSLTFTPPTIPCVMFSVADFGGKSDGTTSNTAAFAAAVAAAKAAGGGVVDVPMGTWFTGAIHLDSKIELHLEMGATIKFSAVPADYPTVLTRWEGLDVMNWSPMIYALGATDVAITGKGTLQGPGSSWGGGVAGWKSGSVAEDQKVYDFWLAGTHLMGISGPPMASQVPTSAAMNGLRPTFVECNGCTNFLIEGISVNASPYWTLHPLYSKNVIIRNVAVDTTANPTNGDGIDPDSCDTCLIEHVQFNTSDDLVAVKSGLNEEGIAVARPSHNIVIRNISASGGHAISIGSEMSGGVNNVYVTSDTTNMLGAEQYIFRIKTIPGRGGTIQNIFVENTTANADHDGIFISGNYGSPTIPVHNTSLVPVVKNVSIKNVSGSAAKLAANLVGLNAQWGGFTFDNVKITPGGSATCTKIASLTVTATSNIPGLPSTTTSCP